MAVINSSINLFLDIINPHLCLIDGEMVIRQRSILYAKPFLLILGKLFAFRRHYHFHTCCLTPVIQSFPVCVLFRFGLFSFYILYNAKCNQ
nr:MAG TPA: hypothetical protein [Caudoviricetes sp.]